MIDKRVCLLATLILLALDGSAQAQTGSSTVTPPATPPPPPTKVLKKKPPRSLDESTKVAEPVKVELPASATLDQVLEGKDKTGTPARPPLEELPGEDKADPAEEREAPDYDTRAPEPLTSGEFLIWIPRVIFFPVHLVFEYLLRWPLVRALTWAEEVYLFKRIKNFFTWRDGKSGIYPTFFADFGLKPSIGFTTFHRDFPADGNAITARFGWWGPRWINASVRNRTTVLADDSGAIDVFGSYIGRPDFPFYGTGSNTRGDVNPPFRYQRRQGGGGLAFTASLGGLSKIGVSSEYRFVDFEDDPSVSGETLPLLANPGPECALGDPIYAAGCQAIPGFNAFSDSVGADGLGRYHLVDSRLWMKLDTRDPDREFKGGTGFLVELFLDYSFNPAHTPLNYFKWGGELAGFYDITDLGHVIAFRLHSEFLWNTGSEEVPFTELPSLGGLDTMRGYLPGRFLGGSTIDLTLSYRYPVWSLLDAEMFVGVGNAFDGTFGIDDPGEEFDFERLYLNAGIGLRTSFTRDSALEILLAFGTSRFDGGDGEDGNGVELDSVRFVFGLVEGF